MKKHNCPYLRMNNTCSNKNMRIADCIYNEPAKCPVLRDSKAWTSIFRFFKRKSIPNTIETPKNTITGESNE